MKVTLVLCCLVAFIAVAEPTFLIPIGTSTTSSTLAFGSVTAASALAGGLAVAGLAATGLGLAGAAFDIARRARGKRSVCQVDVTPIHNMIDRFDEDLCIKKLVCSLQKRSQFSTLEADEQAVLELIGDSSDTTESRAKCERSVLTCPYSSVWIMNLVRTMLKQAA